MLDTVIDTVWLILSVLWDFLISWIHLLIVFGCHPSRTLNNDFIFAILVTHRIINFKLAPLSALLPLILSLCTMIFKFVILVTPRIINFRLAPASASLRLTRSLRIYYSMLFGSGICLISGFFQLLAFLCTFTFA